MAKRLVFVISDIGSGGAQQVAVRMINHMSATGWMCSVVTFDSGCDDFFRIDDKVQCVRLGMIGNASNKILGAFANLRRIFALRAALKKLAPDTVVSFIAPTNCIAILASAFCAYKLVVSERNDPSRQSFGLFWDAGRIILYRFADIVTANSRPAIKWLARIVPKRKLSYLPNPIRRLDNPEFILPFSGREKILIAIGRLHSQKNYSMLLRAFSLCVHQLPDWRLFIAGEGGLEGQLMELAKELNIDQNVEFLGRVENSYELLGKASIFLMPSLYEGQPNALLEAMKAKCPPIVSSDVPDIDYILNDGQCGVICNPHNEQEWAVNICSLIADVERREKHARNASERVVEWELASVEQAWHQVLS
ncbi:glycosyltransferase [Thalassospira alkalitolerans]|uniref:glycosyltransferase n=1 Tax=Thalassospira alkalitolerans TaxID=1293890 RepID=UPI0030ED873D|tara:strand:- start:17540 stop:18631 length:1092 start_codon:yes stop_codon:yes gene_type:complete